MQRRGCRRRRLSLSSALCSGHTVARPAISHHTVACPRILRRRLALETESSLPLAPTAIHTEPHPWTCRECTVVNPATSTMCSVCSAARPSAPPLASEAFVRGVAAHCLIAVADFGLQGDDGSWQCRTCTLRNPAEAASCSACGAAAVPEAATATTTAAAAAASAPKARPCVNLACPGIASTAVRLDCACHPSLSPPCG